jgi:hypothetical protein
MFKQFEEIEYNIYDTMITDTPEKQAFRFQLAEKLARESNERILDALVKESIKQRLQQQAVNQQTAKPKPVSLAPAPQVRAKGEYQ